MAVPISRNPIRAYTRATVWSVADREDGRHSAGGGVGGQQGGDGRGQALPAMRGQDADAGDLGDAVERLAASRRERAVRAERGGQHRMPGPQPLAQHRDRAAVVVRGDLVPLSHAGLADGRARMAERHGRNGPDPVELSVFGRDDPHCDSRRQRRHRHQLGMHHERMPVNLEARLFGGGRHLRRGLLYPLEGLRDDQLTLPGADRADVGHGDRRPRTLPRPRVVRPSHADRDEDLQRTVLLGSGPAARDRVAESINPLNDRIISHNSPYHRPPAARGKT